MLGRRGSSGGGLGHGGATMELKRTKGARRTAGATHTSCKARPLVPLRLCTAPGPQEPRHLLHEIEMARGEVPGHSAWGDTGRISNRAQIRFATGPRLSKGCFGTETAASQETSCTSVSVTLGRRGQRGACMGTEETREEGGSRGGGEQAAAGLSHQLLLPRGLAATCHLRAPACLPLSERPATASGRPGCS